MKKQFTAVLMLLTVICLFSACGVFRRGSVHMMERTGGSAANGQDGTAQQVKAQNMADAGDTKDKDESKDGTVSMVVKHDLYNRQITLMGLSDGITTCYEYTDGTEFFDKYGNYTLSKEFSEGKLVVVQRLNSNETLGAIAFTDQTWDHEGVRKYSIDAAKDRMSIAGTSYRYAPFLKVFSDGAEADLYDIGDKDTLDVYGIGRTIYSVVVQAGHGTLELVNTELFEGGWLNLGTKVYTTILKDMSMEVPEGIYDFSVANDGYGDSGEILIRRGKTTTIDLNDYKGEGPKICKVTFKVGVENAILTINGKEIDPKETLELRYGIYELGVYVTGYDVWTRNLVVNSPTATIDLSLNDVMQDTEDKEDTEKDTKTASSSADTGTTQRAGSLAGSKAGSLAGSRSGSSSGSSSSGSNTEKDATSALANAALGSSLASIITGGDSTDYLDTLSDLVDSLDKLNRSSSKSSD